MTLTIPDSDLARTAYVDYSVLFSGSHTNRFSIYLDGTRVHPSGTTVGVTGQTSGSGNTTYDASTSGIALSLPASAGAPHTVEVRWQSSDSTSAVNLVDRSLAVDLRQTSDTTVKSVRNTTSQGSGTVPSTDTLVSGMSVSIPSSSQVRTALVDYTVLFSGSHTNRFSIYLDGTRVHPTGSTTGITGQTSGSNTLYNASAAGIPISLTSGSSHTLQIRWQASDATTAVTWVDRALKVSYKPTSDPTVRTMRNSVSATSGTMPTTDTLVPGMTLSIPSAAQDRVAMLDYTVLFSGTHTNRFSIYLDGVRAHPTGSTLGLTGQTAGSSNIYDAKAAGIRIPLAGGSDHTIEVRWQSANNTDAVTMVDRAMSATIQ